MKLLSLLLLPLLLLSGCATTGGHVVSRPEYPPTRVIVVQPEYYTPMYIHMRSDFWYVGKHHYHHRYRR
jgi:uncharacterized protein YceK